MRRIPRSPPRAVGAPRPVRGVREFMLIAFPLRDSQRRLHAFGNSSANVQFLPRSLMAQAILLRLGFSPARIRLFIWALFWVFGQISRRVDVRSSPFVPANPYGISSLAIRIFTLEAARYFEALPPRCGTQLLSRTVRSARTASANGRAGAAAVLHVCHITRRCCMPLLSRHCYCWGSVQGA